MPMDLEPLLNAHASLRVERPPGLWEADIDDAALVGVLGEMIVATLLRGTELGDIILRASNVTVAASGELQRVSFGPLTAGTQFPAAGMPTSTSAVSGADSLGQPDQRLDMVTLRDELTAGKGFDDILVLGSVEPDVIERVAPGLDVYELIASVTPMLLGVTPDKHAPSRGRKR